MSSALTAPGETDRRAGDATCIFGNWPHPGETRAAPTDGKFVTGNKGIGLGDLAGRNLASEAERKTHSAWDDDDDADKAVVTYLTLERKTTGPCVCAVHIFSGEGTRTLHRSRRFKCGIFRYRPSHNTSIVSERGTENLSLKFSRENFFPPRDFHLEFARSRKCTIVSSPWRKTIPGRGAGFVFKSKNEWGLSFILGLRG